MKQKADMAMSEDNLVKRIQEGGINYTLLKLIHHELGNGLAVLSGYRHLLQRALSTQAQEASPPGQEVWQHRNKQLLGYLQTMRERETLLNDFLAQLRALSPGTKYEQLCQDFVRTNLVDLLGRVTTRLAPLHPDRTLQVHMPAQPLFIMCDSLWMEIALEHILNHTIEVHTASTPVNISLELFTSCSHMPQEAKITVRIKRVPSETRPGQEGTFETWPQLLDQEVCVAMCSEILQEHGGRLWSEQRAELEAIVFIALPLPN